MATATAPKATPKTTTSVDPLFTQAVAQAKATLAAQQAPVKSEQAASDASYAQQQTDALDVAKALNELLKPIGPAVRAEGQAVAQNQELAGSAFSQGMQDALRGNTDNLNSILQKVGAPGAPLQSHATEAGDLLYGLGGYGPGTTFAKQAAATAAAADTLPGTALLKGQENYRQLGIEGGQAHAKFDQTLAEMAGKLPGDVQANYSKLQSLALQDKKFAEQVAHDKQTEALARAKYKTGIDEFNARQTLAYKKLQVSENQFAQRQANADRNYALSLQRLGITEKRLQLSIAGNAFKMAHGGFTAAQVAKFGTKLDALQAGAGTLATGNGTPQYYDKGKGKWVDVPAGGAPPGAKVRGINTYSNFITAALKKGVPLQMALERANILWPDPSQRDALPPSLEALPSAAAAAGNFGSGKGALGFANGAAVTYQIPKGLSAKGRTAVSGVLSLAREYLGTPYVFGGESVTGFDCSGLAQYIYGKEGISIPRTTYDQFRTGLSVPRNQLQAGDLVFFKGSDSKVVGGVTLPGHVGIYVGGGKFIQAPHTGDVVKVSSLSGMRDYMGARRYVH